MALKDQLPPLGEVLRRHGISPRKSLGQHFLLDLNLTTRVARAAGDLTRVTVIEIGPGPGGLTRALLDQGARRVIAIERDKRCVAALAELGHAYPGRLTVIEGDALDIDPTQLSPPPRKIAANLPYNISTALLLGWLRQAGAYESLTLMFQKEVGARLAAAPGTKAFGRLAVVTQWLCEVRAEFTVTRRAFTPPPKVDSQVVTLTPRPEPLAPANMIDLETVTRAAFGQRRKMLRTSLKSLDLDLAALGIDGKRRAEELAVEDFCTLARAIAEKAGC